MLSYFEKYYSRFCESSSKKNLPFDIKSRCDFTQGERLRKKNYKNVVCTECFAQQNVSKYRPFGSWLLLGFLFLINVHPVIARYSHICANSNESVVKFRRNLVGDNHRDALKICIADKIIGKHSITFEWPIDLCDFWVSSLFGLRTHHGVTKMHKGVDLAAFKGTAVKTAASGVVIRADKNAPGYGTLVEILHSKNFKTRYGHLDEILVQVGDKVIQSDLIGTVGAKGNVRGKKDPSHLHFEILQHEVKVDPLKYLYCGEVAFTSK